MRKYNSDLIIKSSLLIDLPNGRELESRLEDLIVDILKSQQGLVEFKLSNGHIVPVKLR